MNKEDLEQYIKTLELKPGSKHLIFIDMRTVERRDDLFKLTKIFPGVTFLIVRGNPHELIKEVEIHE